MALSKKNEKVLRSMLQHLSEQPGTSDANWRSVPGAHNEEVIAYANPEDESDHKALVVVEYNGAMRLTPAGSKYLAGISMEEMVAEQKAELEKALAAKKKQDKSDSDESDKEPTEEK